MGHFVIKQALERFHLELPGAFGEYVIRARGALQRIKTETN
jgi:hypothetical protein